MPELTVNGETRIYGAAEFPATVGELVESLGLFPAALVAEVEGRIVRRADFGSHGLRSGDRIELVELVGGG